MLVDKVNSREYIRYSRLLITRIFPPIQADIRHVGR